MNQSSESSDLKQQLSALMDGELGRDEARFLLRRIGNDAELAACWQRWHHAGDCLAGRASAPLRADFSARIAAALEAEAAPRQGRLAPMLRWAGGVAVAASVTLAALLAMRPDALPTAAPAGAPAIAAAAPASAEVAPSPYRETDLRPPLRAALPVSNPEAGPMGTAIRLDPRIESYLVRHNEATAARGYGFVPYVTLVTPLREAGTVPAAEPSR
jgi:sigma-E factor negative regulatory protein RseA